MSAINKFYKRRIWKDIIKIKMTGIYRIVNIVTGKVYVGSAININKRWSIHKLRLKENKHHSIKLQNSVNKHGIDNFLF